MFPDTFFAKVGERIVVKLQDGRFKSRYIVDVACRGLQDAGGTLRNSDQREIYQAGKLGE